MNRILTTSYSKGHNCTDYHSLDRGFFGMLVTVIFSVSSVMEFFFCRLELKGNCIVAFYAYRIFLTYTHAHLWFPLSFLAVNHHNNKNWVPSILTHNLWLIFMGMKQKKIQNGRLKKKLSFSTSPKRLFVRIDGTQFLFLWWFIARNECGNHKWVYVLKVYSLGIRSSTNT